MFDIGAKKFRNVANKLYAQMMSLLLVRARWRVRLWVQDLLGSCEIRDTISFETKKEKLWNEDWCYGDLLEHHDLWIDLP